MAVTIHAAHPNELVPLLRDLQVLDGTPGPHRIRRAVHGSGVIVEDDLALAWLTLVQDPTPQFLQRLMREDPSLWDLVGRRAPAWALQELAAAEATAVPFNGNQSVEHRVTPDLATWVKRDLPPQAVDSAEPLFDLAAPEQAAGEISLPVLEVPARRAAKSEWETWATESGLVSSEQAVLMTKAAIQELVTEETVTSDSTEEG